MQEIKDIVEVKRQWYGSTESDEPDPFEDSIDSPQKDNDDDLLADLWDAIERGDLAEVSGRMKP